VRTKFDICVFIFNTYTRKKGKKEKKKENNNKSTHTTENMQVHKDVKVRN
jgi:hypothetical protein